MQLRVRMDCSRIVAAGSPLLVRMLLVLVCLWVVVVGGAEECSRTPPPGTDCSIQVDCQLKEEGGEEGSGVVLLPLEDPENNTRTCYRTCIEDNPLFGELCEASPTVVTNQKLQKYQSFRRLFSPNFFKEGADYRKSTICRYKINCEEDEILSYSIVDHSLEGRSFCSNTGQDECLDSLTIRFQNYGDATLTTCGSEADLNQTFFYEDGAQEVLVEFEANREHEFPGFLIFAWCAPLSDPSSSEPSYSSQPPEAKREAPDSYDTSESLSSESSASRTTPDQAGVGGFVNLRLGRRAADVRNLRLEEEVATLRPWAVMPDRPDGPSGPSACTIPVDISTTRFSPGTLSPGTLSPSGIDRGSYGNSRSRSTLTPLEEVDRVFHIGEHGLRAHLSRFLRLQFFESTVQLKETVSYCGNTIFLAVRGRDKPLIFKRVYTFHVYNRVSKFVRFLGSSKGTFSGYGYLVIRWNFAYFVQKGINPKYRLTPEETRVMAVLQQGLNIALGDDDSFDVVDERDKLEEQERQRDSLLTPFTFTEPPPNSTSAGPSEEEVNARAKQLERLKLLLTNFSVDYSSACNSLVRTAACTYQEVVLERDCVRAAPVARPLFRAEAVLKPFDSLD